MLIDTHVHLNDERLLSDVENIVSSFKEDDISAVINVGYDLNSSKISIELGEKYQSVFSSAGIHPHDAKNRNLSDYDYFTKASKSKKCVAYGEIGLDFYYDLSDRDIQKTVFLEQLELAESLNLPIIIHLRDAYLEMQNILKENKHYLKNGAVMHCYMGSKEMMKEFCKLGPVYFAFGGAITFKNADKEEIIKAVPLERLLIETDCPYMTPVPYRGQLNTPKNISLVRDKIQAFIPDKDIGEITAKNAITLFNLPKISI